MSATLGLFESVGCPAEDLLRVLREDSVASRGVPEDIAERATEAVRANIRWDHDSPCVSRKRVEGYYWAAVRGMVLRSRGQDVSALKSRFALGAIVEDTLARAACLYSRHRNASRRWETGRCAAGIPSVRLSVVRLQNPLLDQVAPLPPPSRKAPIPQFSNVTQQ